LKSGKELKCFDLKVVNDEEPELKTIVNKLVSDKANVYDLYNSWLVYNQSDPNPCVAKFKWKNMKRKYWLNQKICLRAL